MKMEILSSGPEPESETTPEPESEATPEAETEPDTEAEDEAGPEAAAEPAPAPVAAPVPVPAQVAPTPAPASTPAPKPAARPAPDPVPAALRIAALDLPAAPARLGNALASEWTKIRTVQSTMWTLVSMFGLILGIGLMADAYAAGQMESSGYLALGLGGFIVGQIPVVTLGVLAVTSEYGTGMIRTTLTAYPRRAELLTAKAVVFFGLAFVLGTAAVGLQVLFSSAILDGHNQAPDGGAVLLAVLGGGLYLALIGLFSLAVGTLLRHSAGAIAVMLGLLLLPFILALFLPDGAGVNLLTFSPINMSAALFGEGSGNLGGWGLLGVLAAGTAAVLGGAYAALLHRDA
ncbi:ABC transporter permease subunit [Streptacidiphilus albus]|uniref:ABC transporter permease subunit n=1 Tax=Streptacidiphilus albus TaxID=105425 RepID=UPI000691FD6B|nr:ABC transporter permease subunit [Streptacidiphilus albus]